MALRATHDNENRERPHPNPLPEGEGIIHPRAIFITMTGISTITI